MQSWYKQAQNIDLLVSEISDPGTSSKRLWEIYFSEFHKRSSLYRGKSADSLFSHPNCPPAVLTDAIVVWGSLINDSGISAISIGKVLENANTPSESLGKAYSILKRESKKKKNKINPIRSLIENYYKIILYNVACPINILSSELVGGNPLYQQIAFENPSTPSSAKLEWVHSKGTYQQGGSNPATTATTVIGKNSFLKIAMNKTDKDKIIFIMRGCPGSGKSTTAKNLPGVIPENIFAADNLIEDEVGGYDNFFRSMKESGDWTPLDKKHKQNIINLVTAMKDGKTPIVYDNTNICAWNCKEAVKEAIKYGYHIKFIDVGTAGLSAEELTKRNKHNVPLDAINRMIEKYKAEGPLTIEKVLGASDPKKEETKVIPPGINFQNAEDLKAKLMGIGLMKSGEEIKRVIIGRFGDHKVVVAEQNIHSKNIPIFQNGN